MKRKLIATSVLALAFAFTQSTYAMPPKPSACPKEGALQTVPMEVAQKMDDGTWGAGVLSNKYNTSDLWSFIVGKIDASDEEDAMNKANKSLKTLKFAQGPVAVTQYNVWACLYQTDAGYIAAAVTPALGLKPAFGIMK